MTPIVVTLPIRTVSEANSHEHWRKRQRRAKGQRMAARLATESHAHRSGIVTRRAAYRDVGGLTVRYWDVSMAAPLVVTLTRIAPRALDSDNAVGSAKHIRDGIADALGIDDRDSRVEWRYAQRRGEPKQYAVEIRIEPKEAP